MTCADFERWLDDGRLPAEGDGFLLHARQCTACARSLAAAEALTGALREPAPSAPPGFTDAVMTRIERPASVAVLAPVTPWWLRTLNEPAAVLALLLIGMLTTAWNNLATLGVRAIALMHQLNGGWSAVANAMAQTRWGAILDRPEVTTALLLGALCLALVGAPLLYRTSLRMASRAALGRLHAAHEGSRRG